MIGEYDEDGNRVLNPSMLLQYNFVEVGGAERRKVQKKTTKSGSDGGKDGKTRTKRTKKRKKKRRKKRKKRGRKKTETGQIEL